MFVESQSEPADKSLNFKTAGSELTIKLNFSLNFVILNRVVNACLFRVRGIVF